MQAACPAGGHPRNGCKAVSGMARPQGIEGYGMAGLGETLGSLWIPLDMRACLLYSGNLHDISTIRQNSNEFQNSCKYHRKLFDKQCGWWDFLFAWFGRHFIFRTDKNRSFV
jgi:hypothetical protein